MRNCCSLIPILLLFYAALSVSECHAQNDYKPSTITKVVLLGTGNPNPDPEHPGPSVAIVVNDIPYLVDFGPGVVRQAAALSPRFGGEIEGLRVKNIKRSQR